ncbi:MAG: hydroxylamine reductase, partial [Planctomycetaceae bacterium]
MSMFCYQCEQTAGGKCCTVVGVCGKDASVASLQDLLVYAAKDISRYAHRAGKLGAKDRAIDLFVTEALFSTVTNVNFDTKRLAAILAKGGKVRQQAVALYTSAAGKAGQPVENLPTPHA